MLVLDRFLALQTVLDTHEDLWRPQPFRGRALAWRAQRPALAEAVDALSAAEVAVLEGDQATLQAWIVQQVPTLAELPWLTTLPELPWRALAPAGAHFDWSIPGRKRAQIEAFAGHLTCNGAPLLEWCAGKGHLGRRLAAADGVAVTSLEIDPALVRMCDALASRAGVEQQAVCADALTPASRQHVRDRHVVALHACGELHRTLVRHADADAAHGYSIAPCCYYRGAGDDYRAMSSAATLALDANALRLAVTETVTAAARDRRRQARDQAFKLGFVALREALTGEMGRRFRPVPSAWSAASFASFCRQLAAREQVALPARFDAHEWEAIGWRRRDEVARDSLVRHALRRALELWLAGDLALALMAAGFDVRMGCFCPSALTPRNILIDARR